MFASTKVLAVLVVTVLATGSDGAPPKKIVGGSYAGAGELPYQVSLRVGRTHFCGGSIISSRHILTAAHCFLSGVTPQTLVIVTGTTSSQAGERHAVKSILNYPEYNPTTGQHVHDLAIVTLKDDIVFNEYQNKVDLPSEPTPAGVTAVVSGWGYTGPEMQVPENLMKLQVHTISHEKCKSVFSQIQESQLCTSDGAGLGSCNGDSGGPLVRDSKLIGVVSLGVPCATGVPDIFTSTYHHLDWILQNTKA